MVAVQQAHHFGRRVGRNERYGLDGLVHHARHRMVLQMGAHSRQVGDDVDTVFLKVLCRADP